MSHLYSGCKEGWEESCSVCTMILFQSHGLPNPLPVPPHICQLILQPVSEIKWWVFTTLVFLFRLSPVVTLCEGLLYWHYFQFILLKMGQELSLSVQVW